MAASHSRASKIFMLFIDADPAGGLVSAIGEKTVGTIAGARQRLIAAAKGADDSEKMRLTQQLDYLVLETLIERSNYSLLAMGHSSEKGCFCPANTLLREAIDLLSDLKLNQLTSCKKPQTTSSSMLAPGSSRGK